MWPQLTLFKFVCAVQILALEFFSATATAETNDSSLLFFYSPVLDRCQWGDTSFRAPNNTANGGVCAYIPTKNRLYACPAGDLLGDLLYVYSISKCFQYMYHQNPPSRNPWMRVQFIHVGSLVVAIVGHRWRSATLLGTTSLIHYPPPIKSPAANPIPGPTNNGAAIATRCAGLPLNPSARMLQSYGGILH